MSLEEDLGPLAIDTAFWMEAVQDPATPIDQLGDICIDVEQKLRGIGSILLLARGNSDGFLHNLLRAAKSWEAFLVRCAREAPDDHNFCAGLFAPLLDALAARDVTLAARICDLAPVAFRAGHENEDDFYYAHALRGLIKGTPDERELPGVIDRCADTGDALSAGRSEVLTALLARSPSAFDDAFRALVSLRESQIEKDEERGQVAGAPIQAERRLFVEGVALLNLADVRGISVELDYPLCPSLARVPMVRPFTG